MDYSLKLIDDKTLCLIDRNNKVILTHKARWTKFEEFKRIDFDCTIIRENNENFKDNSGHANIYCLNDIFRIIWTIAAPHKNDFFPSPIIWNRQTKRRKKDDGYLTLDTVQNFETFMCSSWSGFTVTVDYRTGKILSSEFTK